MSRKRLWVLARVAAEAGLAGFLAWAPSAAIWPDHRRHITEGVAAAWLASMLSVAWMAWARERSAKAFWRAFGGGIALRAAFLAGLMAAGYGRPEQEQAARLLSYVLGLVVMLPLECRKI